MSFRKKFRQRTAIGFGLAALTLTILAACSATVIDNDSPPEAQFAEGERLLKSDRFLEAVERFRILKSRYPYSKYAALASLKIGDAHFEEEAFIEAASAYKIFRELYPKHERAPYALFRIGESFYNLVPSSSDRDLDSAQSAIDAYNRLITTFPGSEYKAESEKRIQELRSKLAEKEAYVAEFYFKRELYQAAAGRWLFLLQNYPGFGHDEESLYKLAFSLERLGEYARATEALDRLERNFPQTDYSSKAKKLREKISQGKGQKG